MLSLWATLLKEPPHGCLYRRTLHAFQGLRWEKQNMLSRISTRRGAMPGARRLTSGRQRYCHPPFAFWQAFPCGTCRCCKGFPVLNGCATLAPLPPCAECAGPLPVRPVWVVASLGAIADPARHTACGPPRGPDPKRLRAGPAGRPGQGRVITTLPVACRVRSRSSPSTARSSGRTWLTCGVKAPSANQPNSLAMLAVSTSGRKAR